ncbi:MAG: sensor domain-containing diguanylate cyclase [Actinomycetota bacterium]|nr:sensor domain-containing diguanylate cyclase [Actinomycetota bacterium]
MSRSATEPTPTSELVPLAERTNVLQAFRLTMVAAVLISSASWPHTIGATQSDLAAVTAVYALLTVAVEVVRRALKRRSLALLGSLLLADGLWIAAVVALTEGPRSVLAVLVGLHIVAVTLLASYRTGLKIAVWHSLLFVTAHWLASADAIGPWKPLPKPDDDLVPLVVASVVMFLVLAIGTAAFSALNERELRRGRKMLRGLVAMGEELQDVQSPDEVGPVLLRCVLRTFGAPRGAVAIGDEGGVRKLWVGKADEDVPTALGPQRARPGDVLDRCWRLREPQLVRALGADDGVLSQALPAARNLVVVPMVTDGEPIGALVLEQGGGLDERISTTRINALVEFAAHGALSIRKATLLAEVERLARVDALTGLPNRRTFDETLHREVARAARSGEPLSLVMLDVDHFKQINDTYGHDRGDEVLREIGAILATSLRQIDLPARFGGEEFAFVLPDCTGHAALRLTEEVRSAIASAQNGDQGPSVTVSAGVASFPRNALTGAELTKQADEALYQSKRGGRDRATLATRTGPGAKTPGAVA